MNACLNLPGLAYITAEGKDSETKTRNNVSSEEQSEQDTQENSIRKEKVGSLSSFYNVWISLLKDDSLKKSFLFNPIFSQIADDDITEISEATEADATDLSEASDLDNKKKVKDLSFIN